MTVRPDISVLIPARNEGSKIAPTIQAIARARTTDARVEFVVVDDASTDDCIAKLASSVPQLLEERRIDIRVCRLDQHSGNYRARNQAAALASADILFITDAHVKFSKGWDEQVLDNVAPDRILAATVTQEGTPFRGYGCWLVVPMMTTTWNRSNKGVLAPTHIAPCSATIIPRDLFERLGGYDPGMLQYGAGEPEFSVRAWLHGADVRSLPELEIVHDFKARGELAAFLSRVRCDWVHNAIRFGLLYLSELGCLQMLRYHARAFPAVFQRALGMVDQSDVWERRALLEQQRQYSFDWFVDRFSIRNQIGGEII
jgi:glycosyltransferase involved in cell wall biosynthesis